MKEFDIEHKIDFVVTDNAANMRKSFTVQFPMHSQEEDSENDEDDDAGDSDSLPEDSIPDV